MIAEQMVEYGQALKRLEHPTPVPQGTEVLIRIHRCGVCHSDIHIHDGHFDMGGGRQADIRAARKLPFTLGHEIVGVVEALGPEATGVAVGDARIAYPWIGCGACPTCDRGLEHLCPKPRNLGVNVDGGFADHVVIPHSRYLVAHDGIPLDLAGPLACSGITAYSALKKLGELGPNDPILIVGAGGVGMMGIQIFRALFGRGPLVADIDPAKREAALAAGAAAVYDPREDKIANRIMKETNGGVAGVVDFVGAEATTTLGVRSLRRGGKLVIVGLFGGAFTLPLPMFPWNGLSVEGSMVGSLQELRDLVAMVQAGKVKPIPVDVRPLSQASQALEDLKAGRVVGRVVLSA
ncbi:alcohol dehydrogenase [Zavarzinia sp. CC-PAN008]|uniref:alcohol dehydrogenase n=1 Tax=Zavarzinia sp. CC-PAN008 TaxID=3243332 RepID=UPI003F746505